MAFTSITRAMDLVLTHGHIALPDMSATERSVNYLAKKTEVEHQVIYGVNTGFGSLCDRVIAPDKLSELQQNLILSHACGTGPEVPSDIVRLMLLLKVGALSRGNSGARPETIARLTHMYNAGVLPVVYEQGSLGASGDLAPLAHLCLPLLGRGEVYFNGKRMPASEVLKAKGWEPLTLGMKEGLALLNGTQFMTAFGAYCVYHGMRLSYLADLVSALALDAFHGRYEPFHPLVHSVRPQKGHGTVSRRIMQLLEGSHIGAQPKAHVQDPYSFRCIPQVHGATIQALLHVKEVIETEMNAVSDNPLIFPDDDLVISAGNFHGQPLAVVLDYAAIALSELASISERRTFQLILGLRGLPVYLVGDAGLNSGFMIPQYTAAGIVSQNKQLSTPASVDSIVSSNGQEDHVSMGANAATKLHRVVENVYQVLAIELFTAAQALDFRRPNQSSPTIEAFHKAFRNEVPFLECDTELAPLMHRAKAFLKGYAVPESEIDLV